VVVAYLAASATVALVHVLGGASTWLLVHIFLLGAVTNAIVTWGGHFATTLLRPRETSAQGFPRRLALLNAAVIGVLVGVSAHAAALTITAVALFVLVIAMHGVALARLAWMARAGRFAVTVRFFWIAAVALVIGAAVGTALAVGVPAPWDDRLLAAHVQLNVFGWIALTVLGTEFSLWPMVLRTRMVEGLEAAARHALPLCAGGLALAVAGLLIGIRPLAVGGLAIYAAGVARSLEPFVRTARQRPPRTPAAWMLAAATTWLLASLVTDLVAVLVSADADTLASRIERFVPWVLAGFVAQAVLGALTYLLPVVLGGGPAGGRRNSAILDRHGAARTAALNVGVLLVALHPTGVGSTVGWSLVATAFVAFVVLAVGVLVTGRPDDETSTNPR
jgi:nitrite reductase (NO-forming)